MATFATLDPQNQFFDPVFAERVRRQQEMKRAEEQRSLDAIRRTPTPGFTPAPDAQASLDAIRGEQPAMPDMDAIREGRDPVKPKPVNPAALDAIRQPDVLDERLGEYIRDPDAFERRRMAAPPVSGELRYSIGGGPMKSYNVGANRSDVTGDRDFERTRDDKAFGQDIAPRTGGGTVSQMQALNDPMDDPNYRNYLANAGRLDEAMEERARTRAYSEAEKDPLWRERALAGIRAGEDYRAADLAGLREESRLRAQQATKLDALRQLDEDERMLMSMLGSAATPEQRAEEQERIRDWRARREIALGLRDRLDAVG